MTDQASFRKPLTEQILDEMLTKIASRREFDKQVVAELKRLATSGGLTRAPQVENAIRSSTEAAHETS